MSKWQKPVEVNHRLNNRSNVEFAPFPAYLYGTSGLAISRELVGAPNNWVQGRWWRPIHVPSGCCLGPRFRRRATARLYVEAVAPLTNWLAVSPENAPSLGLNAEIKLRQKFVEDYGPDWLIELTAHKLYGRKENATQDNYA